MPATAQSTSFTLPRGSSVIFELGGIGTATVDPSRISNVYRIGTQEAFLGPYDRSLTIFVSVESGTINYRIDADGDLSDQSPALAALGAEVEGLSGGLAVRQPPSALNIPDALAGLRAYGTPGVPSTWRANICADDLIDPSLYVNTYWVDADGGNDANSGLTWALRKQSISSAYTAAQAAAAPARIYVKGDTAIPYHRALSLTSGGAAVTGAYPVIFEAFDGRVITGAFENPAWTPVSTYYTTVMTSAIRIYNPSLTDQWGLATDYIWRGTAAEVEAEPGTWNVTGSTVAVRPHNGAPASIKTVRVLRSGSSQRGWDWATPASLFMRGFDLEGGINGAIRANLAGAAQGAVILDDCSFRYAALSRTQTVGTTVIDGAQIFDCGALFAAFRCDFSGNSKDGLNVHKLGGNGPFALAVNCTGRKNGSLVATSNQGFTLHDGLHGASIGSEWTMNAGGGIGHANSGTVGWHVGDIGGITSGDVPAGGVRPGYAFGNATGASTLYLDHCRDVGAEFGLYNFDTGTIYQHQHRGVGKRSANVIAY